MTECTNAMHDPNPDATTCNLSADASSTIATGTTTTAASASNELPVSLHEAGATSGAEGISKGISLKSHIRQLTDPLTGQGYVFNISAKTLRAGLDISRHRSDARRQSMKGNLLLVEGGNQFIVSRSKNTVTYSATEMKLVDMKLASKPIKGRTETT